MDLRYKDAVIKIDGVVVGRLVSGNIPEVIIKPSQLWAGIIDNARNKLAQHFSTKVTVKVDHVTKHYLICMIKNVNVFNKLLTIGHKTKSNASNKKNSGKKTVSRRRRKEVETIC